VGGSGAGKETEIAGFEGSTWQRGPDRRK